MGKLPRRWSVPVLAATILLVYGVPARAAPGDMPLFTGGLRAGALSLNDSDAQDTYGLMPLIGADAKFHFFTLPLAAQASFDWSFGTGEVDEIPNVTVTDSDSDISLYAIRLTAILEPRPGVWGSLTGGFYLTPYVGVGVGVHIVDQQIDADTSLGQLSESASESVIGYHALGGVDLVFNKTFSLGVEVLYTSATIEDALEEDIDIGGFSGSVMFRLHF